MADPKKSYYPEILPRYLPAQVAIRWCGLLEHEECILAEMVHRSGFISRFYPKWPELRSRTEIIVEAMMMGDLPSYQCDTILKREAPTPSIGESDTVRHVDLKPWFTKFHPNDKPAFLFGKVELAVETTMSEDYRGLKNGKQVRVKRPPTIEGIDVDEYIQQNANSIWLHQNEVWEYIQTDKDEVFS